MFTLLLIIPHINTITNHHRRPSQHPSTASSAPSLSLASALYPFSSPHPSSVVPAPCLHWPALGDSSARCAVTRASSLPPARYYEKPPCDVTESWLLGTPRSARPSPLLSRGWAPQLPAGLPCLPNNSVLLASISAPLQWRGHLAPSPGVCACDPHVAAAAPSTQSHRDG